VKPRTAVLTIAAGLGLADASIVTLALPQVLHDLSTSVRGVAAVLAVYTVVLAVALLPAELVARRAGPARVGAAGFALLAAASILCGASGSLTLLLVGRGLQAAGAAGGLVAVFELVGGAERGRRLWLAAAVFGAAVGPALGGALTQAFDWRAIFYVQAPPAALAALAAVSARSAPPPQLAAPPAPAAPLRLRPALALALVSGALTAVLFLLVLLLVAGWAVSPLRAAAAVTVIPIAALVGARAPGQPALRASAGAALIGAGVLSLAWLPQAHVTWTLVPAAVAGLGMGMALPALAGELVPERTPRDAARLLAIRHAGIAILIFALAPLLSHQLSTVTESAKERGVALVLDAPLPPASKIELAPSLLGSVDADRPRAALHDALAKNRSRFHGSDLAAYDALSKRADDTLVEAVADAFHDAFVIAGALAFLAAFVLLERRAARTAAVAAAAALGIALPVAYVVAHDNLAPTPVAIRDPCKSRPLPGSGGITGFIQDRALQVLDATACRLHASREELVLALADPKEAKRFKHRHGVDPRSPTGLLGGLLGG
jgi:predicted MFS family arabinose efflux permease